MKLLTPSQVKDAKALETAREIFRSQEVQKVADTIRKNLANAEADFNLTLAKHRKQWATEEEEYATRKAEMKKEIEALETRKAQALIPIEVYKRDAELLMVEALGYLEKLKKREESIEALGELLEDKLDAVGKEEQDVILKSQKLNLREKGIAQQSADLVVRIKEFNKFMAEFMVARERTEKDIEDRKANLFLAERSVAAKAETQKRTDEALTVLAKQLEDQRATLERALTSISP